MINDINHKQPERDRIAAEIAEFEARGGQVQVLRSYGDLMHEPLPNTSYRDFQHGRKAR